MPSIIIELNDISKCPNNEKLEVQKIMLNVRGTSEKLKTHNSFLFLYDVLTDRK